MGMVASTIWFSPDKKSFVQQVTGVHRLPTDSVASMVPSIKSGHVVDDVRYYQINGGNVADIRCRPYPTTSRIAKFSRFLVFEGDAFFDTISFSSTTKQDMNNHDFQGIYRRLGVPNY